MEGEGLLLMEQTLAVMAVVALKAGIVPRKVGRGARRSRDRGRGIVGSFGFRRRV
jgi:hypothetical protein